MRLPASIKLCLLLPLCFTACRKNQVTVYEIPKEALPPRIVEVTSTAQEPSSENMADRSVVTSKDTLLTWTAPASWRANPASAMRKGSYSVGEEGEQVADLAITAFPGNVGGDLANVNRWRAQLQLAPVQETELSSLLETFEFNGLTMKVLEITGGSTDSPQSMLSAIVSYEGATWFFKLMGPELVVKAAKNAYFSLLKSVKPSPEASLGLSGTDAAESRSKDPMANTTVLIDEGPGLHWTAPQHWQSQPATGMRKASFNIINASGATAELVVTAFPGDVGGELANINRWRGQVQLPAVTANELSPLVTRLTVDELHVTVVDFASPPTQRLLGAIVPLGGATWFFKIMGPSDLIDQEKSVFLSFLQTLRQP